MAPMVRMQKRLLTRTIAIIAFICLFFYLGAPAQARNVFDIVSIDLTVSPNPIPCGGTATATATIQMPVDKDHPDAIDTTIDLYDYDTLFRDGDDLLARKSGIFTVKDDKIVLEYTLHCQIKDSGCELYGPSGNSGESGTYVFVRVEDTDTKSPRVYVKCKQTEMDAIVRLDGPDGPDSPDEPTTVYDDNTILPGGGKIVTMSAEEPISDAISGSWRIEYDPANLVPTQVDYVHPEFSGALQHEIFSDHIAFEFSAPSPGRFLDGELLRVHFEAVETPAAQWEPTYVQCGDDGSFTNSMGEPIQVCMGGPLSLFVPPVDEEAPMLHPENIHFGLREINGGPGAVTDNRSDLENYLTVALYDENFERVAAGFVAADGSFHLGTFFVLSPEKTATLVVYDGVENQYAYSFIPVPDLEDAVSLLKMLSGLPPEIPLLEDISGDGKTGLDEVVYVLQRVSGQRIAPPVALSIIGTVPAGTGGGVDPAAQVVEQGSEASFTVTPDTGYEASPLVGGTCPVGTWDGATYSTGSLTANCSVEFSFIPLSHTVAAEAGPGGVVEPSSRTVDHGTTASFTVTPDMDYEPDPLVGGTCPVGTWDGYTYTTGPATGDCSVAFSFTLIPFSGSITTLSPNVDQENMAPEVPEDTSIQVEFNKTISDSMYIFTTGDAEPFFTIVESESGSPVEGHVTVQGSVLTFNPTEQLKENMTYWLSVSENVFNITSPISDPETYHWSITTQDVLQDVYRVWHPIEGSIPRKYYDVGYEIDGSRNLSLQDVHDMISNAENSAEFYNNLEPTASPPPLSTEKFTKFHFWPNIINLSAVYDNTVYPELFDLILDDAWNYTNNPTLLTAQITSDIMDGDRVFLARDFIDKIIYNFQSFYEVHYVMIINLDKKTVTEILGHQFSEAGLPVLHDPHTELLQAAFDGTDDSPGEVWDMCLRGNRTKKYQAINVDRLLTESGSMAYFISRVDLNCLCASCPPFDSGFWDFEPDVPWEPWIPPVIKIPEEINPPPGGNGGGIISGNPPAAGNPVDNPEDQPVEPWTFPATPLDEDTANPDSDTGDEETGGACEGLTPGCNPEDFETAGRLSQEIDDQLQDARDSRAGDVTTFSGDRETTWGFKYEWKSGATFNDPCIQAHYENYNSQIANLQAEIDALVAQYGGLYDQRKALRDNANNVFQALLYRENLWSNMLEVNGEWQNVDPEPCMPPWIPAGGNPFEDPTGGGVVIVGARLQAKFQRVVAYAMMNGKTFDQAVEEAINSKDCYPNNDPNDPDTQPRATVYKDAVFVMIWKQYAECLKNLHAKIARNYMNMVFGGEEELSEEDINKKVAALLLGVSSLSPSEREEYESLTSAIDAITESLRGLSEQIDAKRNEIDRLRREFRQKALDCLKASLENIRQLRAKSWILQAFLIWCENHEAEEAFPQYVDIDRFCRMLNQLLDHPDTVQAPKLKAYLEMLVSCNC
ncbi:MAG: Ig-like domain-containing protein [Desulfatiglandaceae bacterium]